MGDEVGGKMKRTSSTICIKKLIQAKKLLADLTTVNRQNLIVTRNTDHVKENQKEDFQKEPTFVQTKSKQFYWELQ